MAEIWYSTWGNTHDSVTGSVYAQVFSMKQTAQRLAHCDPEQAVVEEMLDHVAQKRGLPTEDETIADAPEGLADSDWKRFWDFTEAVWPNVAPKAGYVPIPKPQHHAVSSQLMLY